MFILHLTFHLKIIVYFYKKCRSTLFWYFPLAASISASRSSLASANSLLSKKENQITKNENQIPKNENETEKNDKDNETAKNEKQTQAAKKNQIQPSSESTLSVLIGSAKSQEPLFPQNV